MTNTTERDQPISMHMFRLKLLEILNNHFNEDELRDLCYDLELDWENVPGDTKKRKARELINYCERYNCLEELLAIIKKERPKIPLEELLAVIKKERPKIPLPEPPIYPKPEPEPKPTFLEKIWFWGSTVGTILVAMASRLTLFSNTALVCMLFVACFNSWLLIKEVWWKTDRESTPDPIFGLVQTVSACVSLVWIFFTTTPTEIGLWVCWAGLVLSACSGFLSLVAWWNDG